MVMTSATSKVNFTMADKLPCCEHLSTFQLFQSDFKNTHWDTPTSECPDTPAPSCGCQEGVGEGRERYGLAGTCGLQPSPGLRLDLQHPGDCTAISAPAASPRAPASGQPSGAPAS